MAEMMQGGMPKKPEAEGKAISVDKDVRPLVDEISALMGEGGEGAGTSPKPDEAQASTGEGESEGEKAPEGAAILAEVLDISMEKAQALLDAAMKMPRFADKSPAQIAEMLDKDMNLRMQLEKNLGAGEDMKMKEEMAKKPAPPAPDMM
jgi:hypothetical protein